MTSGGFVYGKDEMLDIYKLGRFRDMEFVDNLRTLPTPPLQRPSSRWLLCRWLRTRSSSARTRHWGLCSRLEVGEVGKASGNGKAARADAARAREAKVSAAARGEPRGSSGNVASATATRAEA